MRGSSTGGAVSVKNSKGFEQEIKKETNKINLSKIPGIGKIGASVFGGPDSAGMLNISEGKKVTHYTKDSIKIYNIGDIKYSKFNNGALLKWKNKMAIKIQEQFKDFGYKTPDIEGYIFKDKSDTVNRIKHNQEFKNMLIANKDAILNGKNFSGRFNKGDLHYAFASVDFYNDGFDKNGNLHLYMFDTYDFNEGENALVEAGRRQMLNGELKGFFTIHEIVINKNEVDKLKN